jgi:septal ring factor EnvC (AmiA/AmiB activator)
MNRLSLKVALVFSAALLLTCVAASAQDIRGMELCTAEKQMERRTGCLQANIELLQQMLVKQTRDTNEKLAAANRDVAAAKTELAATKADVVTLKAAMAKLDADLTQMKAKPAPAEKPSDKK